MANMTIGIIGCGDFLRWMAPGIKDSKRQGRGAV